MVPRMHRPLTEGARKKTKRDLISGKQMKLMKMRGASVLAEMRRELAPLRRESPGAAQARPEEGQMPTAPQESACSPDPPPSLPGAGVVRVRAPVAPLLRAQQCGTSPGSPRGDVWKAGCGSSRWGGGALCPEALVVQPGLTWSVGSSRSLPGTKSTVCFLMETLGARMALFILDHGFLGFKIHFPVHVLTWLPSHF